AKFCFQDRNLKYLMVAGEEFKASLAHKAIKYLKNVCIENLYGPTECTVYATRYRIDHDFNRSTVPIGKELDGVQIKILDSNGIEVPIGVQGEMYISGNGVAEGYLNLPTINNEKFLFIDGEKYYKTGDYAKRLKDGNIEFIGRKDYQVQINGIRVELGEIEDIILKEIKEINMVKVLYENNKLYCFYQAKKAIVPDDIKKILKNFLPSYMIPNFYKQIDEFPLTINRKIDTKALMSYHDDADMIHNVIQNDVSDTQQKILSIFRETLHVDSISLYDSFFDLGGDSLDVISVIIELENYYNINLDESVLYNHQNVSELAGYIEKRLEQENEVTKQFQKTAEDINIDHIKSQISSSYYKNNKSIGTIEKVYPVYYHQKNYIKDNFNSAIDIKIDVKKDFQLERVIQACKDIILSNELLRSVISLESEQVVFKQVKLDMDSYEIPLFDLSEYSYDSATLLVDEMTKTMAEVVLKSPLDELLYTVAIFELQQKYIVVFVLSHNIADLSNKHILIKQFMDLLNGHKLGNRLEYKL
ncbi:amino acid adenylation protein, partial [Anoxybacillus ayderensis]|uniref:AMP-binding protein n=1 Tax=Anoxybacillus ayderensis TaxID=265546 RepID=UPI000385D2FD